MGDRSCLGTEQTGLPLGHKDWKDLNLSEM